MPECCDDRLNSPYCPRGNMENRIKDCQLDLFADRMSAHVYKANQVRLIFAAFAYVLIDGIRRVGLKNTALGNAVSSTSSCSRSAPGWSTPCGASSSPCPTPVPAKTCSSRLTPRWPPIVPTHLRQPKKAQTSQEAKLPSYLKSTKPIYFRTQLRDPAHFVPTENKTPTRRHSDPPDRSQIQRYKMAS